MRDLLAEFHKAYFPEGERHMPATAPATPPHAAPAPAEPHAPEDAGHSH